MQNEQFCIIVVLCSLCIYIILISCCAGLVKVFLNHVLECLAVNTKYEKHEFHCPVENIGKVWWDMLTNEFNGII